MVILIIVVESGGYLHTAFRVVIDGGQSSGLMMVGVVDGGVQRWMEC